LAEIEANDSNEIAEPVEKNDITESVDCKLEESYDFPIEHTVPSSQELPPDTTMMELDPIDTMQSVPQPVMQQPQWPDMSQASMNTDVNMDAFGGFTSGMNTISTDFMQQPVSQTYQSQNWQNPGFVSTPDLVNFQQPGNYMNYTPAKEVIQVPTSQFANFVRPASQHSSHHHSHSNFVRPSSQQSQHSNPNYGQFSSRQSVPPNFFHHANTTGSRRFTPKLINIPSSSQRGPPGDQPPPPPPKDEHRFSRISMRRRPSNISQHTIVSHRDLGWHGEDNWG
jgi:hypothetical protein